MARSRSTGTGPAHAVQVVSRTWARDSHELFDFEARHHRQVFAVSKSTLCVRNSQEVQMLGECEQLPARGEPLLRLVQREGSFWVDRANPSSSSKKLWTVVHDLPGGCHRLSEGDVMKLGRFKFRVRQLSSACSGAQPELRLEDSGVTCCTSAHSAESPRSYHCRICLLEGPGGEEDPLIAPCQCRGTIEYVHLGCLRHWIRGRLNLSNTSEGSYFYRPLPCELCKAVYHSHVLSGNERVPLVEVPWTQPPFIVLENMVRDSQQHTSHGLHVISLANKTLKLGRGHKSDVRMADASISRCHATIRFERGHFLLEDNKSKFGTLVGMKKPLLLDPNSPISIQMGRTVLAFAAQLDSGAASAPHPLQLLPRESNASDECAFRLSLFTRISSAAWMGIGAAAPDREHLPDGPS